MKIITRFTDEELSKLYSKYNYDNLFKYFDGFDRPWYFIPPELVLHTYCGAAIEIYDLSVEGFDPNWDNWIGCNALPKILRVCCELTPQEYFDLLVLHINDTDDRPKCDYCGSQLKWSGRVTAGYGSGGHYWNESTHHFCEQGHTILYRNSHLDEYPEYKEFIESGGAWGLQHNNPDKYDPCGSRDYKTHIETFRSHFENCGLPDDECYFYIASTNKGFKFGITENIEWRISLYGAGGTLVNKIKVTLIGKRKYIADVEAEIKYKLGSNHEYLDWKDVPKFIQAYGEVLIELKDIKY